MVNYLPLESGGYITGFISFGTGSTNQLTVTMISPKNNESNISTNPTISFAFNQVALNVNNNNVKLYKTSINPANLESISSVFTDISGNYSFTPLNPLTKNTNYHVVFESGITDILGNKLSGESFTFNTIDNTNPRAFLLSPAINQTKVSLTPLFAILFSESVVGVQNGIKLRDVNDNSIALADFDYTGNVVSFNNLAPLNPNSLYSLTLESSITDLSGNKLDKYTFYFITGESQFPIAYLLNPIPNSFSKVDNNFFKIKFSVPMNSFDLTNMQLKSQSGVVASLSNLQRESTNSTVYTFKSDVLLSNMQYQLSLTGFRDYLNNKMADTSFTFNTVNQVPLDKLIVTMSSPVNGSQISESKFVWINLNFSQTIESSTPQVLMCSKYQDLYDYKSCYTIPSPVWTLDSTKKILTHIMSVDTNYGEVRINVTPSNTKSYSGAVAESSTFNFFLPANPTTRTMTASVSYPNITKPIYPLSAGESMVLYFSEPVTNFYTGSPLGCTKPYRWISSQSVVLKEVSTGSTVQTFMSDACGDGNDYTMILKEPLKANTNYMISFPRPILSSYATALLTSTIAFSTKLSSTLSVSPYNFSNGQSGLGTNFIPNLNFSEPANLTSSKISFTNSSGTSIPFTVSNSGGSVWNIVPNSQLTAGMTYYITVDKTTTSIWGTPMSNSVTYSFTTQAAVNPAVSSISPYNGATNISLGTSIISYITNQNATFC